MNAKTYPNTCEGRFRSVWHLPLAAFVLFALLMAGLSGVRAASTSDGVKIVGTVTSAPNTTDGVGLWDVVDDMGHPHTVEANVDTEFEKGVPQIGDRVEVETESGGPPPPLASKIRKLSEDDGGGSDPGKAEVEGTVVSRPTAENGIGTWLIQTQLFLTQTVIADGSTQFDDGVPALGTWVEAEGPRQPDGSIQATRIRPDEFEDGELVVWLEPGVLSSTIEARYNIEAKSSLLASANIFLFETEDDEKDLISQIVNDADVIDAELNFVQGVPEKDGYSTWGWGGVDPGVYTNQYAFAQVNLAGAQGIYNGAGSVIAVMDTGVNLTHTMLATRLRLPGLDVVADDTIPEDEPAGLAWGHGTHVAGIIARIAPEAEILPIRVLNPNGQGNSFLLAYAIDWAIAQDVDVINLSLGADNDSKLLREKIKEAIDSGIVVIAAAGNDAATTRRYPAAYPGVVGVAAVDQNSLKATFSNYGTWIDLSAPGVGITSTVIGPEGQGYASWSGTSMAAPFVSGAAALVQQRYPSENGTAIADRLTAAAGDLDALNPTYIGDLGGLLNIGSAAPGQVTYLPSVQR